MWLKSFGSAIGTGLLWAVTWAPVGVLVGAVVDADGSMDEPWAAVGALPGFLCGVVFVALLRLTQGVRTLDAVTLRRAAAWGAVSGLLAPALFVLAMGAGLGTWSGGEIPWTMVGVATGSTTLVSAVAAAVSQTIARWRSAPVIG